MRSAAHGHLLHQLGQFRHNPQNDSERSCETNGSGQWAGRKSCHGTPSGPDGGIPRLEAGPSKPGDAEIEKGHDQDSYERKVRR